MFMGKNLILSKAFTSGSLSIKHLDLVLETSVLIDKEFDEEHIYHKINGFEPKEWTATNDKIEQIKLDQIKKCLGKLKKDGNVDYDEQTKKFIINFDGFILWREKGYGQQIINENEKSNAINNLRKKNVSLSEQMNLLTLVLAFFAFLTLAWSVIQYFLEKHNTVNYHFHLF